MTKVSSYNNILVALETMDEPEVIRLYNNFCEAVDQTDRTVFRADDFNDLFSAYTPREIAEMLNGAEDFNINDDFFTFRNYDEIVSFNLWNDPRSGIDAYELAEYINESGNALNNETIDGILNETH